MAAKALDILLLEDVDTDALLAERELRQAGIPFALRRARTRCEFLRELETCTPNLVLSDYNLPGFSGLEALAIVREKWADLPFIFLSGAIGDELAIETLTRGATDYVLKDRMVRLGPAVRRAMEEAALRAERRRLELEVLEGPIREQMRIGRDLHDVVGQNLTATMFLVKSLEKRLRNAERPEADETERIAEHVRETIRQVRILVRGLCPVEPTADGLRRALAGMCENVRDLFKTDCRFECSREISLSDRRAATELYYIAQEAVNNALKHSGARSISVVLAASDHELLLNVSDNGKGLPAQSERGHGMGLGVMDYRAKLIGAQLRVGPGQPGGTVVECRLPLSD